jgi:D-alanyl-D-alanine dipeptidase
MFPMLLPSTFPSAMRLASLALFVFTARALARPGLPPPVKRAVPAAATAPVVGRGARSGDALVDATTVIPSLRLDIRYATANNFTGEVIYPRARCLLRLAVARRLRQVQVVLAPRGLGLKVYDCYRPLSAQRKLWNKVPNPRFVADPAKGSRHNRGAAVDITLVTAAGVEVPMPTGYDEFTPRAHRRYNQLPAPVLRNRATLENAMVGAGFIPTPTEWWHFDAPDWSRYALEDTELP